MKLQAGKVVNGVIVVDDDAELEEGAIVTVIFDDTDEPVEVTELELAEIRQGLAEADRGEFIAARAFLAELRSEGAADPSR